MKCQTNVMVDYLAIYAIMPAKTILFGKNNGVDYNYSMSNREVPRSIQLAIAALKQGGLVVLRTDTIYGIVARANDLLAVKKVFTAKKRQPHKQCIILVTKSLLSGANTPPTSYGPMIQDVSRQSSRPTSVIVPASNEPAWLLNNVPGATDQTVAYRLVTQPQLVSIIDAVGPIIAPSANPEGQPPASNVQQAKAYFGGLVDYYLDGGTVPADTPASRIVRLDPNGQLQIIRD